MTDQWLVRKLLEQDKKIEALSRGGTGVGHTSIAPGEALTVISDDGEVVLGAGGVEYVDGPTPATPSAPSLKLGFGTIEVTWDGSFAAGEDADGIPVTAPLDLAFVEVHASTDPLEEEWGDDTRKAQVKTKDGFTVTVGGFDVDDEVFVCLIAVSEVPKSSAPSATASLVIEGLDFSQLFNELDAANATIKNAGEILVTEQDTLGEKLDEAFDQIADAVTSANGKNSVHFELAAPTTDDAGIAGDTWFVGSVVSGKWVATAQFQHDGTGWVPVELSHQVIGSVDVGSLVAGSAAIKEAVVQKLWAEVVVAGMVVADEFIGENAILTGAVTAPKITVSEELWAKFAEFVRIRAEMIEADAIDGMVITGPNIRTSASGARVQLDAGGLSVYDSLDDWQVRLTPDGSSFKGDLEAESLVANGAAEFKSTDNLLAQGAKLTLAAGVTDPTAPPVVQPYWDGVEFDVPAGEKCYGLAWAGGKYWTFIDVPPSLEGGTSVDRLTSIDPGTGAIVDTIPMADGFWAAGGVTAIGSELFLLGPKTGTDYKYFVRVYSTAGVFLREWEYAGIGYGPGNPLKYKPGIGNDGTNVVIAQCSDSGSLVWRTYNKTTGAKLAEVNANDATKSDISGIYIGAADWGGGTLVTLAKAKSNELVTFTTAGVYDVTKTFGAAAGGSVGVVFAGGKFRALDPTGTIYEYANNVTGDNSGDWWCAYRWETDINSDGTIDYRSKISTPARFTWPRRAQLKATGQPKPVGVEIMAGFLAKKATKPARTDFKRNYTGYSTTRSIAYWDWYQNTGDAPADGNNYPTATPSSITSASSTFEVKGDGSGKWGSLTFNTDGTVAGVPRVAAGRVTITPVANTPTSVTVNLPAGRFTSAPVATATARTGGTNSVSAVAADSETTSTIRVSITRSSTTATEINWTAVQP